MIWKGLLTTFPVLVVLTGCLELGWFSKSTHVHRNPSMYCYDYEKTFVKTDVRCSDLIRISFMLQSDGLIDEDLFFFEAEERLDGSMTRTLSKKDRYKLKAMNMIADREKPVRDFFDRYVHNLISEYVYCWSTGKPFIGSDVELFGRNPGEDLSDLFKVCNETWVRIVGRDFLIIEDSRKDGVTDITLPEYYSEGVMLHLRNWICCEIPDELYDKDITFNVSIPFIAEHYWDYCLSLAKNPDAVVEEEYSDFILEFSVTVPRISKKS